MKRWNDKLSELTVQCKVTAITELESQDQVCMEMHSDCLLVNLHIYYKQGPIDCLLVNLHIYHKQGPTLYLSY